MTYGAMKAPYGSAGCLNGLRAYYSANAEQGFQLIAGGGSVRIRMLSGYGAAGLRRCRVTALSALPGYGAVGAAGSHRCQKIQL
jgi:hypothetical protein